MILLSLLPAAAAFCGTFVGAAGSELRNRASEVVMARDFETTTLTLSAEYEGDLSDFALILPIPEVVTEEDVAVLDPALFDRVAEWSEPRLVAYTCDDVVSVNRSGCEFPTSSQNLMYGDQGDYFYDSGSSVEVEAHFIEGEYEIVVLSAEESADLWAWLDANGYAAPEGGEEILQEYIDGGSFFLAARVHLEGLDEGRNVLSPLQIAYTSPAWSLPIRIGTTNAGGEAQEVVIYALTYDGGVGISNYPEVTVEDECMLRSSSRGAGTARAPASGPTESSPPARTWSSRSPTTSPRSPTSRWGSPSASARRPATARCAPSSACAGASCSRRGPTPATR